MKIPKKESVKAFALGVLVTALVAMYLYHNTVLYIKQAMVVDESEKTITLRFYHDATEQILDVKLPVEKFPVPVFKNKVVIHQVTVGIWPDDSIRATQMMADDVLDILEGRVLKHARFVTDWSEKMPYQEEGKQ